MKLVYTDHAKERMAERRITESQVNFAMAYGRDTEADKENREMRTKRIKVVYNQKSDFRLIITVAVNDHPLHVQSNPKDISGPRW